MDAINDLLSIAMDNSPEGISTVGTSRAESTATGIYLSQVNSIWGRFSLDSTTKGIILGKWVTRLMPSIMIIISLSIFQYTPPR